MNTGANHFCGIPSKTGWVCSLPKGHEGQTHVALGFGNQVVKVWTIVMNHKRGLILLGRRMVELTQGQKDSLLEVIREVLPGARFAPEEGWLAEGQNAKKKSEAVVFEPFCDCGPDGVKMASLTVFLKAPLSGQHYNIMGRLERAIGAWVARNGGYQGCGKCGSGLTIDVRLFRIDKDQPRFLNVDPEEDLSDLSI